MSTKRPTDEQPASRESFDHPVLKEAKDTDSEHRAGFNDSGPRKGSKASQRKEEEIGALVPPRKASKLPQVSLAEKARKRMSKKE